jgi:RNA polymerase sigma factor (sigma-70 family)
MTSVARQYGRRLRRFLASRLRNSSDVPDLAQEVFLRLMRVQDFGSIRSPESYLFTVATHVVQQHALSEPGMSLEGDLGEAFADSPSLLSEDDPEAQVQIEQRIQTLLRVLSELPPRVGATLILARLKGHSLEEIAATLGVSRESVKKYLARALQHCRDRRRDLE